MKALLLALVLAGCATPTQSGQCPGSAPLGCMTKPICVEDKSKGCVVCACESAEGPPPPNSAAPPP